MVQSGSDLDNNWWFYPDFHYDAPGKGMTNLNALDDKKKIPYGAYICTEIKDLDTSKSQLSWYLLKDCTTDDGEWHYIHFYKNITRATQVPENGYNSDDFEELDNL
jgi:hypothetical protein